MYAQQPTPAVQDPRKKRPDFQSTKGNKPSPSVEGGPVNDVAAGNAQSEAPIPYPLPAIGSKPITPPSPGPVPVPTPTSNNGGRRPMNPEAIAARQAFMSKWRADNQKPSQGQVNDPSLGRPMPVQNPRMQPPGYGGGFGFREVEQVGPSPIWGGQMGGGRPKMGGGMNPKEDGNNPYAQVGIGRGPVSEPTGEVSAYRPPQGGGMQQAMPMPTISGGRQPIAPGMEARPRGGQRPIGGGIGGGMQGYPQPDWASMYNGSGGDMAQFAGMLGGAGQPAQSDPRMAYFNMMSGQQ